MIPDSVYIGYISDGNVRVEFASNLANVTAYSLANHIPLLGALPRISGPRIASARNGLARSFLGTQAEWLLMIDTDMTFRADVVERFLKVADRKKAPIVGGLCFGKGSEGLFPTIYHWNGTLFSRQEGWDENSMVACDGTGAAALFVHRSVFEKIAEHVTIVTIITVARMALETERLRPTQEIERCTMTMISEPMTPSAAASDGEAMPA